MRIAVFSTQPYDRRFLETANADNRHGLVYFEPHLCGETARLAEGFPGVCVFVHDILDAGVLAHLAAHGTKLVALRCAGFNNVDLAAAEKEGLAVVRVPAYSPYAVAEHAVGLMLALNRKIHRAYHRVREGNFALEGLIGFDMHGKTAGVVGTGKIGAIVAEILKGFGCTLLAYDPYPSDVCKALGVEYVTLADLLSRSDIVTLHVPLTPQTKHLIGESSLARMKDGAMLINTSRGALLDTRSAIEALKTGKLGYLGLDVYEEEGDLFFQDLSDEVLKDDVFARLLTFPNVVVTAHQAFFTRNAMQNIAETTVGNIDAFAAGKTLTNRVGTDRVK